ncbi:MAG: PLP-dependent transferase [Proteobacteria bacterium]|nr:MAG: PLP-dependent transferase [Pseudomonadota bacterium]
MSPGFATCCVHGGDTCDDSSTASSPNVVMSSTFVVDRPVSFSASEIQDDTPFVYTRWSNPTVRQLETTLAKLEGGDDCQCFASGMGAASAILLTLLNSGDHLVISDTNYPGIAEFARNTLPRFGIEVSTVDSAESAIVAGAIRDSTRLVWIETPANPTLKLTDIGAVSRISHDAGALLVVDSTFATPVATRPLAHGADLVMHSLTKYLGGHGDALGGAVIGDRELVSGLRREAAIHHGGVLSPFNAWLILRGVSTLGIRMAAHQAGAMRLAQFLESLPAVTKVIYPGLKSHPQHELAKRQMENFSGMISFQVRDGRARVTRMMEELRVIHYAVSLGHVRSLIYWLDTKELMENSYRLTGSALRKYRQFAGDGLFRLSVGLEDAADLETDLSRVLG